MKNKELVSGENYTLSQLFSGDRKIIIPDLQRDYCWGDESHNHGNKKEKIELVSGFCENLIEEFNDYDKNNTQVKEEEKKLQLGMIYAYESPINHIQLADGQQRITTLFLLLGLLYKHMEKEEESKEIKIREILMSIFEEKDDDQEPRLQYAIRESTLYFLSDLVVNYFFKKEEIEIKKSSWYFSEYDNDPSIQSMINAIEKIKNKVEKIDHNDFANWIVNHIEILYFDMENRSRGEKMFVVINTTGEPLSATENLKPLLIGELEVSNSNDKNYNKEWEDRETYFWQNKKKGEHEADPGVEDFLTWYVKIKTKTESVTLNKYFLEKNIHKKETLDEIEHYFKNIKTLIRFFNENQKFNCVLKFIFSNRQKIRGNSISELRYWTENQQHNILLPLLAFMKSISKEEGDIYQFLRRLRKNYFDEKEKQREHNYLDWRYVLGIIETKPKDIFTCSEIAEIPNVNNNIEKWYNKEEKHKSKLITFKPQIEGWEDHKDFQGDISPLFKVTNDSLYIQELGKYYISYNEFINPVDELIPEINLLRICLNFTSKSFAYLYEEYTCIQENKAYKIFYKPCFIEIWKLFKQEEDNRLGLLQNINRTAVYTIIKGKYLHENDILNKFALNETVTCNQENIKEFEEERVRNFRFWGGHIKASIFYWMYMERLYDNDQNLSTKNVGNTIYNQIGLCINNDKLDESQKYSFSNIKLGTHFYGGGSLYNNHFSLMEKISKIQNNDNFQNQEKFDKVEAILQPLRTQIAPPPCPVKP